MTPSSMLGLLLALTCNANPLAQRDLREERAALRAADSAFAVRASQGLLPAFRDVLDEDVVFLDPGERLLLDRKSTRLNSSHGYISYAALCLKNKKVSSSSLSRTS